MHKLFTLLAFLAIFCLASPAMAVCIIPGILPPGCSNDDPAPPAPPAPTPDVTNTNTNTSTSSSSSTAKVVGSGNSEVGNGYGNFSPESNAYQGQQQGQIGINEQDQNQNQAQGQDQGQDQGQGQDQFGFVKTDVEIEDNSVHRIDNDFPVNTAAPIFANACSSGVSAQTAGFGGAVATTNIICDHVAVAGAFIALGDRDSAMSQLRKAQRDVAWRSVFAKIRGVLTLGIF